MKKQNAKYYNNLFKAQLITYARDKNLHLATVFKLTLPVATAYVPLGMALGVFMVSSGIAWYWAPISALVIFAGSIEFLVVTFILSGQPLIGVACTALIVNFRHIFYGLSFPLKSMKSGLQKAYGIFALTDETYAIVCATKGRPLSGLDISLLQLISHAWWVGASFLGAVLGSLLPPTFTGFEFALTAMFISLAADAINNDSDTYLIVYAVISCIFGVLMESYVLPSSFLGFGLICYLLLISKDYKKNHMGGTVNE